MAALPDYAASAVLSLVAVDERGLICGLHDRGHGGADNLRRHVREGLLVAGSWKVHQRNT